MRSFVWRIGKRNVSIIENALVQWRRKRRNVSDHRETNIAAWVVELQTILAEHGLNPSHLGLAPDESLHAFVETEYAQTVDRRR